MLNTIKDHRRGQGKRYDLAHVLLFSITALLSGADSYHKINDFVDSHRERLNEHFGPDWKKAPAYTTIRNIIMNTSGSELERIFREYGRILAQEEMEEKFIHRDGKTLRGSFDNMNGINQLQVLSAFAGDCAVILGHEEIEEKSNEIQAARKLMEELGISGCIFTFDALHCREKTLQAAAETGNDVIVQVKKIRRSFRMTAKISPIQLVLMMFLRSPLEKSEIVQRVAKRKFSCSRCLRMRKNGIRLKPSSKSTGFVKCLIQRRKTLETLMKRPFMFQQPFWTRRRYDAASEGVGGLRM